MKKFFYAFLMTVVLVGVSACSKDDDENLVGSKWLYSESETFSEDEDVYEYQIQMEIYFQTGSTGRISMSEIEFTNGRQTDMDSENDNFTYTYDEGRRSGVITIVYDEDDDEDSVTFSIDDDFKKLTIVGDEGDRFVFTKK